MTKYTRDELHWKVTQMVIAGVPIFFAPGELELYPRQEENGYESMIPGYQGMNLNGLIAPKAGLEAVHLEGVFFRQADLSGTDFSLADLAGADFAGATMAGVNIASTDINRCSFLDANLTKASIGWPQAAQGGTFEGANLAGVSIVYSEFVGYSFLRTSLAEAELECARFEQCDFSMATMKGTRFKGCTFHLCTFFGVDLCEATFDEYCILNVVEFRDTTYRHGQFDKVRYFSMVDGDRAYEKIDNDYPYNPWERE